MVDAQPAARRIALLSPYLDERQQRLLLAVEAKELGRGGVSALSVATGAARTRIQAGLAELAGQVDPSPLPVGRSRRAGGGRKRATVKDPEMLSALDALVEPDTRGDPESPLRWTISSTRQLAGVLTAQGHPVSSRTVAQVLVSQRYSLQANAKTREGTQSPDRDAQFRYINEQARHHIAQGQPVVSVDTKKKEMIGSYKNAGETWRPQGDPEEVNTYDFVDDKAGKAIPYGVYDVAANRGWVSVGVDHDTATFAVAALRSWWCGEGAISYPQATRLLICADGGGSNGHRVRLWKVEIARLAEETGLEIMCCHFPPGTSKWNKIEHRLWSQVTSNWRGRPLTSREVVVNLIGATTTSTGLSVHAELDTRPYATGVKVTDAEFEALRPQLVVHPYHPDWNYSLLPTVRRRGL